MIKLHHKHNIDECDAAPVGAVFATPMNTVGVGDVVPATTAGWGSGDAHDKMLYPPNANIYAPKKKTKAKRKNKKIKENNMYNSKKIYESYDEDNIELNEDDISFDNIANQNDEHMTEEELKIEALKISTNIAKVIGDCTIDDLIAYATKIAKFIRQEQINKEESTDETPAE